MQNPFSKESRENRARARRGKDARLQKRAASAKAAGERQAERQVEKDLKSGRLELDAPRPEATPEALAVEARAAALVPDLETEAEF